MNFKIFLVLVFVVFCLFSTNSKGQINIAISNFKNNSGAFYLDAWEQAQCQC